MTLNVAKICRICLAEGARNIFDRITCSQTQSGGGECVASLENLLEKMRYVTMMQIKENDSLPKMICDNCIVQLNVSYNFKRKAMENDLKLRQFVIEKGLNIVTEDNTNNAPTLYYTSNISIVHNNTENVDINKTNGNDTNLTANITRNGVVNEQYVPGKESTELSTIPHPIPIKVEFVDSPNENECNTRCIPELNLPNSNLMVIVNENNVLSTQSIPSSNSTSTIPSSSSSSFTNENNLRDTEFLRNYVQNKIDVETSIKKKSPKMTKFIGKRFKPVHKNNTFIKKHIKKTLANVSEENSSASTEDLKIPLDLKRIILDQKENFSSALKMRTNNKKLIYGLRRKSLEKRRK